MINNNLKATYIKDPRASLDLALENKIDQLVKERYTNFGLYSFFYLEELYDTFCAFSEENRQLSFEQKREFIINKLKSYQNLQSKWWVDVHTIKEQRISGSRSINKCDSDIVIFRNTQWF